MEKYNVGVIVGSLRKGSLNLKMAKALMKMQPVNLDLKLIDISELSLYNDDLEVNTPASWVNFREEMQKMDAVLFITPEYNRSIPGVLKNAIDIGSRPYGKNVFANKPGAIISVTPGNLGAFGANHHLRQILVSLNVQTLQQPEAYISGASKLFDDNGDIIVDASIAFAEKFLKAFQLWISQINTQL